MSGTFFNRIKPLTMFAIIGADGTGKSTVLSALAKNFKHERVRNIHILPKASKSPSAGKPIRNYEKPPHSTLYSVLKLFYRALTWTIKYHFKLAPMRRSGVMIICDQFYFLTMVIDPLKARYGGPHFLARWVLRLIPKPDVYILFDAPLEVIYRRKQETTREEAAQLIERHRKYIAEIDNGYTVDAGKPVEQVTTELTQKIVRILEQK